MNVNKNYENKAVIDNQYYNCIVHNNTEKSIPADFNEVRNGAYINNIEDWKIAIIRYKLTGFNVPLFTFEEGAYTVRMTYFSHDPVFDQLKITDPIPVLFQQMNKTTSEKYVYDYKDFIDMVNNALLKCFMKLDELVSTNYTSELNRRLSLDYSYPKITYDPNTKLFAIEHSIKTAGLYSVYFPNYRHPHNIDDDLEGNRNVKVYFSPKLFSFFNSFPAVKTSDGYILQIVDRPLFPDRVADNDFRFPIPCFVRSGPPPAEGYIVKNIGSYSCLWSFHRFNRFIITTTMPVVSENLGFNSKSGEDRTVTILTDYELSPDQNTQASRDYIYYHMNNDYRWANFRGNGKLSTMNWSIYVQDQTNLKVIPLMIPAGGEVYVKLLFKRRAKNKYIE